MRDAILVLTNTEDGMHTDSVVQRLQKIGERVFRFDVDCFTAGEISVLFSAEVSDLKSEFHNENKILSSRDIKSVWYRRPNNFKLKIEDEVQKSYAERELVMFLNGLWATLPIDVFWVSHPQALELGRKKMLQLCIARELGLRIPRTIITNEPEQVRNFYVSCGKRIIFKAIYGEFLNYGDRGGYNIPTTIVSPAHLDRLDLIRRLPGLFQEYIEKSYELRITVVGREIFAVKIESQRNELSVVDWRNPACIDSLEYSLQDIPQELARACFEMLSRMGLVFGAFDFIVNPKGEIWFLEVNPNGQWYWLEQKTGAQISQSLACLLCRGQV